ncbi:MAG: hypothetical protein WCE90_04840 [Candidatus Zixiibacteriota bacterium]
MTKDDSFCAVLLIRKSILSAICLKKIRIHDAVMNPNPMAIVVIPELDNNVRTLWTRSQLNGRSKPLKNPPIFNAI